MITAPWGFLSLLCSVDQHMTPERSIKMYVVWTAFSANEYYEPTSCVTSRCTQVILETDKIL
jgi:hypothetical protein